MTEEMDNIVVLTDEDGNEVQFEHVVTVTPSRASTTARTRTKTR